MTLLVVSTLQIFGASASSSQQGWPESPSWRDTCSPDTLSLWFWNSSSDLLPTGIHCNFMTTLLCVCVCVRARACVFSDIFLTSTAMVQHQQLLQTH
ncbi:hypothetical protein DsansV1_C24g0184701 [Dioscorea sansibarensis]